jgi:hypothetical protein
MLLAFVGLPVTKIKVSSYPGRQPLVVFTNDRSVHHNTL